MSRLDAFGVGVAVRDVAVALDAFPEPDAKQRARELFETGGGPVPTALVTMARLGRHVAFGGVVGDDPSGAFITDGLRRERVGVEGLVVRPGFRSPASVVLIESGRRAILEYGQYDLPLDLATIEARVPDFDRARCFLADARLVPLQIEIARRVRRTRGFVVLDCGHPRSGVDELLAEVDVAILSHTYPRTVHGEGYDPEAFLEDLLSRLPQQGLRIAGLTLGEDGSVVRTADHGTVRIAGHRVPAVDSTGAGDVYHGAFAHALLAGDAPPEAARFANAAAALACESWTGRGSLPDEARIRALAADV